MKIDLYDERGNLVATRVQLKVAASRMGIMATFLGSLGRADQAISHIEADGLLARASGPNPAPDRPWRPS